MKGKIKNLNPKFFGFISRGEGEKDLFFHGNDLVDAKFEDLTQGMEVDFEIEQSPKGPKATNVSVASEMEEAA